MLQDTRYNIQLRILLHPTAMIMERINRMSESHAEAFYGIIACLYVALNVYFVPFTSCDYTVAAIWALLNEIKIVFCCKDIRSGKNDKLFDLLDWDNLLRPSLSIDLDSSLYYLLVVPWSYYYITFTYRWKQKNKF